MITVTGMKTVFHRGYTHIQSFSVSIQKSKIKSLLGTCVKLLREKKKGGKDKPTQKQSEKGMVHKSSKVYF